MGDQPKATTTTTSGGAAAGERLIQYASENLVTEVLIHPQYNTLIQCMRNLLSSFTRHRHIIHAGYTFSGNGSWILQDGTFSVADFAEAFQEHDVQRVIRAYADTITMNIHCADAGLWHTLPEKSFARQCKIRINPVDVLDTSSECINGFLDYLAPMVMPTSLRELLETSDVVGNIRFTHPTLYVFPGGQGDAALFGINGFNMLVDGGFNRKACFWDFARHLDRLDAVLMTRLNNSNVQGLGAVVSRKRDSHVYPQIGHFFGNVPDRKGLPSPDGDKDRNPLLIDLFERGHGIVSDLKSLDLKPQSCYRNQEPINLYHKVGHGTLDMYVISPARDSKEVKEFMQKWNAGDQRLFSARDSKDFNFPLQNLVSICALLVWQPANPDDTITRILFPGSTPDFKIQEGLEKLKHLEFMKHSTCTAKSIAPAIQTVASTRKSLKSAIEATPAPPSASYKPISKFGPVASAAVAVQHHQPQHQQQDNKAKEEAAKAAAAAAAAAASATAAASIVRNKADSMDTDVEPEVEPGADTGDEAAPAESEPADAEADAEPEQETGEQEKPELDNKDEEKKVETPAAAPSKDAVDAVAVEGVTASPADATSTSKQATGKAAKGKPDKPRAEVKPVVRSRIDTKPPKSMDRKLVKREEKKSSPTATPAYRANASRDGKYKAMARPATKSSPSSTPAKSAKEANNRKVLESKQQAAAAEEVFKIVADVAKVLKSDKDITDIIPDFDEKELEEKLKSADPDEEESDKSPKTASTPTKESLEINVIKVDIESEKSSPDQKSGPISIEEKDKIEQSEKAQLREGADRAASKDQSRPESAASQKGATESIPSRPESVASHKSHAKEEEVQHQQDQDKSQVASKETSRPASQLSSIAEPVDEKSPTPARRESHQSDKEETKEASHPESVASHISDKEVKETESSRPPSSSSHISAKDEETSIISTTIETKEEKKEEKSSESVSVSKSSQRLLKEESATLQSSESLSSSLKVEDGSRCESLSSLVTEKADTSTSIKEDNESESLIKLVEKTSSTASSMLEELLIQSEECSSESIVSEIQTTSAQKTQSKATKEETHESSAISSSCTRDESLKETVAEFLATEKIVSAKETFSAEASKTAEECLRKATTSSTTSSQRTLFVGTDESRRESVLSHTSDGRQTHSDPEEEDIDGDEEEERTSVKEGRSKSIATIMMTSIYKPFGDVESIDTLEEQEEDHHEQQHSSKSQDLTTTTKTTTLLKSSDQQSSSTTSTQQSSTFSKTASKVESITLTQIDQAEGQSDPVDRKTPPTAPVSPSVKPTGSSGGAVVGSSIASTSGPLSPKDISGKSSPGGLTSESQSIPTPLGRESHTETPESSPKPTSPFPRVSKDDLKQMSLEADQGDVEADLPDLHELRGIECTTALSGSTEKIITTTITTVTKVISSDGKEIVTEQKTVTTTDSSEPDSEKVVVTTTRTTSESEKSDRDQILPKEVALLRGASYRSSTPGSEDDDELPGSPRSATSYELQHSSSGVSKRSDMDADDSQDDIPPQYGSEEHSTARSILLPRTADPMATSFYGALPDTFDVKPSSTEPIPIQGAAAGAPGDSQSSDSVESSSQTWAGHKFLDQADKDFQKALEEHVQARGAEVMSSVTAKYSYSPSKADEVEQIVTSTAERQRFPLSDVQRLRIAESSFSSVGDSQTKTTATTTEKSSHEKKEGDGEAVTTSTNTTTTTMKSSSTSGGSGTLPKDPKDRLEEWGKPLGLPSPAPLPVEGGSDIRTTPKKERRLVATKTRLNNEKNLRKRSESPNKVSKKPAPVYVDLTYVPHNGNSYYAHVEFFKRVRARYYVFSGTEPSRQVYDALLEAKQTWEDKELEVTIIPTYDTDVLGYWVAENEELLAKHRIDLSPSASRCTINLQDHETSCSAYRLEF
ncbi:GL14252 [Drosophila persimilis]|uniref:GL14252 n=1 Tax=Drosophila persimilis TaxID=7234 RepID=B4GTL7_DROPE|nr:GL14252 [Drosophila persimilis]